MLSRSESKNLEYQGPNILAVYNMLGSLIFGNES